MGKYEFFKSDCYDQEVRVPTTHLTPSNWERLCWKWEKLMFYICLIWARYLWFLTRQNFIGLVAVLFVASVISQAIRSDIMPTCEFIRYERSMDSLQLVDERLDSFKRERLIWKLQYNEKIAQMEDFIRNSLLEIHEEIQKLLAEIEECKIMQKEATENVIVNLKSNMDDQIEDFKVEVKNHLAIMESRFATTNNHTLESTNCCSTDHKGVPCWESSSHVMTRRYAINLASRSHGAFVVYHLTSKPVTSGSLLHTVFDAVFGLETYNFAITERTHISPSEAFCFYGSEGKLTIRLWTNATVDAIEYEHDYWRNVVPISAPKQYDVIACKDHECEESVLLSECIYPSNENDGPSQICQMRNFSIPTDQVQLVFKMNHGQEYTCIYQLRVLSWK